jgi:predicted DNA-binding transcriptional regulator YafY
MASSVVRGANASNVNRLVEAIECRCQVVLRDYASGHTGNLSNRVVEPFGFTTNYVQVWCYEPESGMNKLFKTSRIGVVELTDSEWQYADKHREGYIDIFRMTGFEQHRVQVKLGMLARNLLIEEYPLAERDIRPIDDAHWMLDTHVCNYVGVGRFVMGLLDDVEIVASPELEAYVDNIIHQYDTKRGRL